MPSSVYVSETFEKRKIIQESFHLRIFPMVNDK